MMFPDDDINYEGEPCPNCGEWEVVSLRCDNCEDGWVDDFERESDPLWYDEGDGHTCEHCHGKVFFKWCRKCGKDFVSAAPPAGGEAK